MLITPGEAFTAERIIEKALRQDIGPDPTLAVNRLKYKYDDQDNSLRPTWEYKKKYRDNTPIQGPESYFYDYQMIERRKKQFAFDCKIAELTVLNIHLYLYRGEASNVYQ
jgi:hypothetical protein